MKEEDEDDDMREAEEDDREDDGMVDRQQEEQLEEEEKETEDGRETTEEQLDEIMKQAREQFGEDLFVAIEMHNVASLDHKKVSKYGEGGGLRGRRSKRSRKS